MNYLSILLITCTLSAGYFSFGQEPIYKWGEPVTDENLDRPIEKLLFSNDEGFYLLRGKRDLTSVVTYWIEQYDQNLKLNKTSKIEFNLGVMGESQNIEDIIAANGKMYALISHWSKTKASYSLSISSLSTSGELSDLGELDAISAQKIMNSGFYNFSVSDDGSKLIVLAELPFVKETKEIIRVSCFELSSMKLLWKQERELDWPCEKARNNYISVDNDGSAYIFKRIWQKPEWKYALYSIEGKEKFGEKKLDFQEGREVVDYKLNFDSKNNFYLLATYSDKPSAFSKNLSGLFYATIDQPGNEPKINFQPWSTELLGKMKEKSLLTNYSLKDVLLRKDGNLNIILEQIKSEKNVVPGSQPMKYLFNYEYGNMLVLNTDITNGQIIWDRSILKHQKIENLETDDPFGSVVYTMEDDNLFILWNNTDLSIPSVPPANWTEIDGTNFVKHKAFNEKTKHATFLHVIDPQGQMTYGNLKFGLPLFNLHKGAVFEMSLCSNFFFRYNNELVVMAMMHNGGKRYRFGFISF